MPAAKTVKPAKNAPANKNKLHKLFSQFTFITGALMLGIIILVVFQTFYKTPYSPVMVYLNYASQIFSGYIPYRDFSLEYPPLALVFFLIPRIFTTQWQTFSWIFQVEVLIFTILGLWITYKIALKLGKAPWKLVLPYLGGILVIGPILGQQYDIFPAVMLLLSMYYFWLGKTRTSWLWLAMGVMTKLYPAILIPVYLIIYWRNRQFSALVTGLITLLISCLVLLSPFLVTGPTNLMSLINYHSQRGLQIESTYSAFLMLAGKLGLTKVYLDFSFGSWNLAGPAANFFSRFSASIQALVLLATYVFIWTRVKAGKSQFSRLGAYVLLLLAVLLCTSKVFSPQYIIWLLPALPLVLTYWKIPIWTVFAITGILTYLVFPVYYLDLLEMGTGTIILLVLRDLTLIILAVLTILSLKTMKSSD
jgi:uncharacterized membrane protein